MSAHLHPSVRKYLELSDEQRIARILGEKWIGYPTAHRILEKLEFLFAHPKKFRMPNYLIIGDTNNGKTSLIRHFESKHPQQDNPAGENSHIPVLVIQAPPVPHEGRFYDVILNKLNAPGQTVRSRHSDHRQFQVLTLFRLIGLRVLIIDEIQHIIAGRKLDQRNFLNTIKSLGNDLQIPIVGVGTNEALNAIGTDPQLANRFEPVRLPRWDMGTEFRSLLGSFERLLPLKKPSGLANREIASKLLGMIDGSIGALSEILSSAAIYAINTKSESITVKVLQSIAWVSPSERRRKVS